MSRKTKIPGREKILAIEKYLRGEDSLHHLAALLDVHPSSFHQCLQTYQSLGPNVLLKTSKNTAYSSDFKRTAVEDYMSSGSSYMNICKR